jgi:hypothetical protein
MRIDVINIIISIMNLLLHSKRSLFSSPLLFSSFLRPRTMMMFNQAMFASNHQLRIYQDRINIRYPSGFGDLDNGPMPVKIKRRQVRVRVDKQPIPIKDFINFKTMSGNEIILNLDNHENLRNGEIISGLLELGKRDKDQ